MSHASPKHVYEVFIRTTPQKLWDAITKPEFTRQYFYETSVKSDWKTGSAVLHETKDGQPIVEGKVIEVDPPHRLVTTFASRSGKDLVAMKDRPSRVTWLVEERGETCKLTLTHDDFDGETATYKSVGTGWNPIISGLKTLLETGKPLIIGPSAA